MIRATHLVALQGRASKGSAPAGALLLDNIPCLATNTAYASPELDAGEFGDIRLNPSVNPFEYILYISWENAVAINRVITAITPLTNVKQLDSVAVVAASGGKYPLSVTVASVEFPLRLRGDLAAWRVTG